MWAEIIGGIAGILAGAQRVDRDEDPMWKLMANTLGGGILGAATAGMASGWGAASQAGQTAATTGAETGAGVGAGAASGSGAQTAAGIGLAGTGSGAAAAGGAATAGATGAGTGTATVAAVESPQVIKPVLAEGVQAAQTSSQLVGDGAVEAAGAAQGSYNTGAGLSAPNTTGADPNGIFSNVPQYMRYKSPLEQLNYKFEQLGFDKINTEDVIELMSFMQGDSGQQQQPQQQPRQYNREALQQNADMYQGIDANQEMLSSRLTMDSGTMSGAFSPALFDDPIEYDDSGFGEGYESNFGSQGTNQTMYSSLFSNSYDDPYDDWAIYL